MIMIINRIIVALLIFLTNDNNNNPISIISYFLKRI
jgi:hypothetical protein